MQQSKKTRLQELRQEVRTCSDPYELTAMFALENERLRQELANSPIRRAYHFVPRLVVLLLIQILIRNLYLF